MVDIDMNQMQGYSSFHSSQMMFGPIFLHGQELIIYYVSNKECLCGKTLLDGTYRHDISPNNYTARFSGWKFYTANVRNLRHFSREFTA